MSWYAKVGLRKPASLTPEMRNRYGTAQQRYGVRKVLIHWGDAAVQLWPKP